MKTKRKTKKFIPVFLIPAAFSSAMFISSKTNSQDISFLKEQAKIGNMKIWKIEKDNLGNLLPHSYYGVILFKSSSSKVNDKMVLSNFNISKSASIKWNKNIDLSKEDTYKCTIEDNGKKHEIRVFVSGAEFKGLKFEKLQLPKGFKIPEGVTKISVKDRNSPFKESVLNSDFSLPQTLKTIDEFAFSKTELNDGFFVPNNVTSIGRYSFREIKKLPKGFKLPDNIKVISAGLFYKTALNDDFFIPESVKKIEGSAFKSSFLNNDFVIPKSVSSIGMNSFNSVKEIPKGFRLPEGLKTIPAGAFLKTALNDDFVIPKSVTNIGEYAFALSKKLPKGFKLPDGLKKISQYAFKRTPLNENFTIPESVTSIKRYAFSEIEKLPKSFKLPSKLEEISEGSFMQTTLNDDFFIPSTVKKIGIFAFSKIKKLPEFFKLPKKITKISEGTFFNTALNDDFVIPNGVTKIDRIAFKYSVLNDKFTIPTSVIFIGEHAFEGIKKLPKGFRLPKFLKTISAGTFKETALNDDFVIPNSVTKISKKAFEKIKYTKEFFKKAKENAKKNIEYPHFLKYDQKKRDFSLKEELFKKVDEAKNYKQIIDIVANNKIGSGIEKVHKEISNNLFKKIKNGNQMKIFLDKISEKHSQSILDLKIEKHIKSIVLNDEIDDLNLQKKSLEVSLIENKKDLNKVKTDVKIKKEKLDKLQAEQNIPEKEELKSGFLKSIPGILTITLFGLLFVTGIGFIIKILINRFK